MALLLIAIGVLALIVVLYALRASVTDEDAFSADHPRERLGILTEYEIARQERVKRAMDRRGRAA